jgi:hypothetical protein
LRYKASTKKEPIMLQSLRFSFFKRALRRALAATAGPRRVYTPKTAQSIALLFDATVEKDRQAVLEFGQQLEKNGKKVRVLGYIADKNGLATTAFPTFTQKDLNWKGLPKNEKALEFAGQKTDLLLCYNPQGHLPLVWIAASVPASMKIGMPTVLPNDFDVQLETPVSRGARFFLDQLHFYLEKIVPSHHDPARAL